MLPFATDDTTTVRDPPVCVSVTLVHPAKAAGWNEVPFGSDIRVVPSNIVLDRSSDAPWEGEIRGLELESCMGMGMTLLPR